MERAGYYLPQSTPKAGGKPKIHILDRSQPLSSEDRSITIQDQSQVPSEPLQFLRTSRNFRNSQSYERISTDMPGNAFGSVYTPRVGRGSEFLHPLSQMKPGGKELSLYTPNGKDEGHSEDPSVYLARNGPEERKAGPLSTMNRSQVQFGSMMKTNPSIKDLKNNSIKKIVDPRRVMELSQLILKTSNNLNKSQQEHHDPVILDRMEKNREIAKRAIENERKRQQLDRVTKNYSNISHVRGELESLPFSNPSIKVIQSKLSSTMTGTFRLAVKNKLGSDVERSVPALQTDRVIESQMNLLNSMKFVSQPSHNTLVTETPDGSDGGVDSSPETQRETLRKTP